MSVLDTFPTISLEEMKQVKLMNRTDTKFVATEAQLLSLLALASEAYMLQAIDGEVLMPYYTRYYDTPDCEMYRNHLHGKLTRNKVRVRRYEGSGVEFLEVKRKNNKGRTDKKRIPSGKGLAEAERSDFLLKMSGYKAETLVPQIENRFYRLTLVNRNKTERLTIDTKLRFHNLVSGADCDLTGLAIIELKRDGRVASPIAAMLNRLRIKQSGFSKYCMGMALTNPALPSNRFKPRLRMISKMLSR
ncbi:MAG: polyphosphate polymerase domain-containing protein [Bacteroidales bacterium]|nr:polyphosphate polymerase domain-containing protein [Bacteroidales bacterium]